MSQAILENVLILVGESFWIFSGIVQIMKLVRTRDPSGLSPTTNVLQAAANVAWITYFLSIQLWYPFATNFVLFTINAVILYFVLTDKKLFKRALLAIAIISPITSLILIQFPSLSGWLGVVYGVIASTPWLVHVLRTKKLRGISIKSLWLSQIALGCTLTYALLIGSLPLMTGCTLGLLNTWIITYRRYKYN